MFCYTDIEPKLFSGFVDNILPTVDKHRLKIQNKTASTFAIGRFSRGFRLSVACYQICKLRTHSFRSHFLCIALSTISIGIFSTRAPLISAGETLLFRKKTNLPRIVRRATRGRPKKCDKEIMEARSAGKRRLRPTGEIRLPNVLR